MTNPLQAPATKRRIELALQILLIAGSIAKLCRMTKTPADVCLECGQSAPKAKLRAAS